MGIQQKFASIFLVFVFLFGLFLAGACKTPPPPEKAPSVSLIFKSVEASDASAVFVNYVLVLANPAASGTEFAVDRRGIVVNGREVNSSLTYPGKPEDLNPVFAAAAGTETMPGLVEVPVRLALDIPALAAAGVPLADDFTVELTLDLRYANSRDASGIISVSETAVFPFIQEPAFSITSIAVLKAELINTRFRVTMKIENPNSFPVALSSFRYELYGNSLLWADGTEKNVLTVPAKSFVLANLYLLMNFINMKRDLLDQVIRLEDVSYRFNGDTSVTTGVDYLPEFTSVFDLSGYSKVFEN